MNKRTPLVNLRFVTFWLKRITGQDLSHLTVIWFHEQENNAKHYFLIGLIVTR